jgi:wyosine [tRNA(Phe)-imidazoG37] synthetase (radical SAM superfamily)
MKNQWKYIYGPVHSWRLGTSLGIDPISDKAKICNLDCVYCQLGKTPHLINERKEYVPTQEIIHELASVPNLDIDYLTFSGRGEPTLAKNLGEIIEMARKVRKEKTAVITNSTLLGHRSVQEDLSSVDLVVAKLDACNEYTFSCVDRAIHSISFSDVMRGIQSFQSSFPGKLALQIMFIELNKQYASTIADLARAIQPDEIEINTPLRPSAARPLSEDELNEIKEHFRGLTAFTVYEKEKEKKDVQAFDEQATIQRHGNYKGEENAFHTNVDHYC